MLIVPSLTLFKQVLDKPVGSMDLARFIDATALLTASSNVRTAMFARSLHGGSLGMPAGVE